MTLSSTVHGALGVVDAGSQQRPDKKLGFGPGFLDHRIMREARNRDLHGPAHTLDIRTERRRWPLLREQPRQPSEDVCHASSLGENCNVGK